MLTRPCSLHFLRCPKACDCCQVSADTKPSIHAWSIPIQEIWMVDADLKHDVHAWILLVQNVEYVYDSRWLETCFLSIIHADAKHAVHARFMLNRTGTAYRRATYNDHRVHMTAKQVLTSAKGKVLTKAWTKHRVGLEPVHTYPGAQLSPHETLWRSFPANTIHIFS